MSSRYVLATLIVASWLATGLRIDAQDRGRGAATKASRPDGAKWESTSTQGQPAGASRSSETPQTGNQLQRRDARYRLQLSDVIQIDFPLTPEFAQTLTVQPDGYINLRGVGGVHVAGQTIPELTETLRRAYSKVLHNPIINVDLKDFQRPYFIASGFVSRPGRYELRQDTTVTEALAVAGGIAPGAKHSQILLFHKVSDNWASVKKLNVKQMLRAGNLSEDIHLQPGDMIYVPQNTISKIKPFVPYSTTLGVYGPHL